MSTNVFRKVKRDLVFAAKLCYTMMSIIQFKSSAFKHEIKIIYFGLFKFNVCLQESTLD